MAHKRRVFHKRPRRRSSFHVCLLSFAAVFAGTPAAVPATPRHIPAAALHLPCPVRVLKQVNAIDREHSAESFHLKVSRLNLRNFA